MPQTVLIVDDDQMNRELLETVIKRAGYAVTHANSGAQALRLVAASLPDLILLDVRLGAMSGYDVCAHLKSDSAARSIPVIMLTASDNVDDEKMARQAGADGFFPKMRGWQPLLERIKQTLGAP